MVRAMRRSRDDVVDLLRSAGALLLAVGTVVLLIRKSGRGEWTDFELMLVVLVPAVVLYALAIAAPSGTVAASAEPSRSVLMVVAILLAPLALYSFLKWSGASSRHLLYNAGVFAVTGLLAAYGARRAVFGTSAGTSTCSSWRSCSSGSDRGRASAASATSAASDWSRSRSASAPSSRAWSQGTGRRMASPDGRSRCSSSASPDSPRRCSTAGVIDRRRWSGVRLRL